MISVTSALVTTSRSANTVPISYSGPVTIFLRQILVLPPLLVFHEFSTRLGFPEPSGPRFLLTFYHVMEQQCPSPFQQICEAFQSRTTDTPSSSYASRVLGPQRVCPVGPRATRWTQVSFVHVHNQ